MHAYIQQYSYSHNIIHIAYVWSLCYVVTVIYMHKLKSYIHYSLPHGRENFKFRISRTAGRQYTKTENIAYMTLCDSLFELDAHMKWLHFFIIGLKKGGPRAQTPMYPLHPLCLRACEYALWKWKKQTNNDSAAALRNNRFAWLQAYYSWFVTILNHNKMSLLSCMC